MDQAPTPADALHVIWLTPAGERPVRLETFSGGGRCYLDVDGVGTAALDTAAAILLTLRLSAELGRLPLRGARRCGSL